MAQRFSVRRSSQRPCLLSADRGHPAGVGFGVRCVVIDELADERRPFEVEVRVFRGDRSHYRRRVEGAVMGGEREGGYGGLGYRLGQAGADGRQPVHLGVEIGLGRELRRARKSALKAGDERPKARLAAVLDGAQGGVGELVGSGGGIERCGRAGPAAGSDDPGKLGAVVDRFGAALLPHQNATVAGDRQVARVPLDSHERYVPSRRNLEDGEASGWRGAEIVADHPPDPRARLRREPGAVERPRAVGAAVRSEDEQAAGAVGQPSHGSEDVFSTEVVAALGLPSVVLIAR